MKRRSPIRFALATAAFLVPGPLPAQSPGAALVERLRQGGYIVVLLHTAAQPGTDRTLDPHDCRRQRQLTRAGRDDAIAIGWAFRRESLPLGAVLAGPECRTRHTAYLAFGADRVVNESALAATCPEPGSKRITMVVAARRLLAKRPMPGTNTVMVTGRCLLRVVLERGKACLNGAKAGDAIVLRPQAGRPLDVLGCVRIRLWRALGRIRRPRL